MSSNHFLELSEALGSTFQQDYSQVITVKGSMGQDLQLLKDGLSDVIIGSKNLEAEDSVVKSEELASERLALAVNVSNSMDSMCLEELKKIFSGEITSWQNNREIQIINREFSSGIRESFDKILSKDGNTAKLSLKAMTVNSNSEMLSALSSIEDSIGYLSIEHTGQKNSGVKEIPICACDKNISSLDTCEILDTPKITIYVSWLKSRDGNKKEQINKFLMYVRNSSEAKEILAKEGFSAKI